MGRVKRSREEDSNDEGDGEGEDEAAPPIGSQSQKDDTARAALSHQKQAVPATTVLPNLPNKSTSSLPVDLCASSSTMSDEAMMALYIGNPSPAQLSVADEKRTDDSSIVSRLIRGGANVNDKDSRGWTALHTAAYYGHNEVARILLQHGSDVNAHNLYLVRLLLACWAMPGWWGTPCVVFGPSSLQGPPWTMGFGPGQTVKLHAPPQHTNVPAPLARAHTPCRHSLPLQETPLHLACKWPHDKVMEVLVTGGADLEARNRRGRTPLHIASLFSRKALLERLIALGGWGHAHVWCMHAQLQGGACVCCVRVCMRLCMHVCVVYVNVCMCVRRAHVRGRMPVPCTCSTVQMCVWCE